LPIDARGLTDWSRDGKFILLDANNPTPDVWVLPTDDKHEPYPLLQTPHTERLAYFSRFVAYQSNISGRAEIYLRRFSGSDARWPVSSGGGAQPRWRHDGTELYYIAPDAKLMVVSVNLTGDTPTVTAPAPLFQTRIYRGGRENPDRGQYNVAPDGRFLVNTVLSEASMPPIVIVQNWNAR
jgi:hypothetical protein